MHDAIVVGAGAAGAAAAFHLSARGHRVLILESEAMPRRKPCGGGMAASVQRWFPFDLSPAVDQVIEQVRFTWCLEDPVTAVLPGDSPFWIVQGSGAHTLRMSASFSASSFSISVMNLSVSFWILSCSSRL